MEEKDTGHILVADDNRMNRMKLSRNLEQQGHTVETAENGEEALELMRDTPFDVLLLDILMPGISGLEVVEKITAVAPDSNVVLLTASESELVRSGNAFGLALFRELAAERDGENVTTLDGLDAVLGANFERQGGPRGVPFVIRETKRKFQHTVSELTVWERK